jgi:hypothetical protein
MHRGRFGAVLLLAVLMISGCGGEEPDPDDEAGVIGGWATAGCGVVRLPEYVLGMPVTPAKLDAVMTEIEKAGRRDYADSYAGLSVDQEHVRAYVYRVPSATFDDFIRRAAEDVCILVRDAANTAVDLSYWHDRVLADLAYWTNEGIRIVSVGARHDGSAVDIGTRDVERARRELSARYGARAPLHFLEEGPVRPLD